MNPLLVTVVVHSLFSFHDPASGKNLFLEDTAINHALDGKVNEWPAKKFETDPATQFKYAIDNDEQNLYLVLSIANFREQMKIMRQGLNLYFDPKDKKKETKGIKFPVKREQSPGDMLTNYRSQENESVHQENPEQKKAAMKAMRAQMALNITSMKVFGFSEDKSEEQGLIMPGSANIAFAWDSLDAMNIEYRIPLSFFGTALSLDKNEISIGWKVMGVQFSMHHGGSDESSPGEGRHGGAGYGGGRHGGGSYSGVGYAGNGGAGNQQEVQGMPKDVSFWTKYTFKRTMMREE